MRILIAARDADTGSFHRISTYRTRKVGGLILPAKYHGTLLGGFIRSGSRFLAGDSAANWVDYQFGSSPVYRISRA